MQRFMLSVLTTATLAIVAATPANATANFDQLREDNREKANKVAVNFDQLREDNRDKSAVDFNHLQQDV